MKNNRNDKKKNGNGEAKPIVNTIFNWLSNNSNFSNNNDNIINNNSNISTNKVNDDKKSLNLLPDDYNSNAESNNIKRKIDIDTNEESSELQSIKYKISKAEKDDLIDFKDKVLI